VYTADFRSENRSLTEITDKTSCIFRKYTHISGGIECFREVIADRRSNLAREES